MFLIYDIMGDVINVAEITFYTNVLSDAVYLREHLKFNRWRAALWIPVLFLHVVKLNSSVICN